MWPAGAAAEELQSDYDEDFDHPWTCKLPGESPPVLEARRWKRLHEKKSEAPSGFTKYDRCQHEWAQSEYDKEVSGVPEEVLDNANNPEFMWQSAGPNIQTTSQALVNIIQRFVNI